MRTWRRRPIEHAAALLAYAEVSAPYAVAQPRLARAASPEARQAWGAGGTGRDRALADAGDGRAGAGGRRPLPLPQCGARLRRGRRLATARGRQAVDLPPALLRRSEC